MLVRRLTRVVDDVLHDTADVAMAFGVIEVAELGRGLVQAGVGRYFRILLEISRDALKYRIRCISTRRLLTEDGATALSLVANNSTHGGYV